MNKNEKRKKKWTSISIESSIIKDTQEGKMDTRKYTLQFDIY